MVWVAITITSSEKRLILFCYSNILLLRFSHRSAPRSSFIFETVQRVNISELPLLHILLYLFFVPRMWKIFLRIQTSCCTQKCVFPHSIYYFQNSAQLAVYDFHELVISVKGSISTINNEQSWDGWAGDCKVEVESDDHQNKKYNPKVIESESFYHNGPMLRIMRQNRNQQTLI